MASQVSDLYGALAIPAEAFAYLQVQRGHIADLAHDRAAWSDAYHLELVETYASLVPFLPRICARLLDVGSGLGGLDVLLSRHYAGTPHLWLLDGDADAPRVARHSETFNHMGVARRFLSANGVCLDGYLTPATVRHAALAQPFDLIVSIQAWGFHLEPAIYLEFVRQSLAPDGRLILDLRAGRAAWLAQLHAAFRFVGLAAHGGKFERLVFAPK